MDSLNSVSVFLACAESGGFSAAGRRLNMSRSAVGKAIARLEGRLGVRLFHRTTRTQHLTDEGQLYFERARRAIDELEAAEAMLNSARAEPAGLLKVTMPVIFGRHCVAPLLVGLMQRHPRLRFDAAFSDRVVDLAEEGFDLAVRLGPLPDRAGLKQKKLAEITMTVCGSPSYLAQRGAPRTIADLADHELLFYGRPWLLSRPEGGWEEIHRQGSRFNFDDLEAVADAAAAGMGLAWLPCWLIRERCGQGSLTRVLAGLPALTFGVHAVWPDAPFMPRRLRAVIDLLTERLPDQMPPG